MTLYSPEGITFGNANHLPDATIIADLDSARNTYQGHTHFYKHPSYPGAFVRMQRLDRKVSTPEYRERLVHTAREHFSALQDSGIVVPPHRYAIGPCAIANYHHLTSLYLITDQIEGRPLQTVDTRGTSIITSIARYLSWVRASHQETFLWDKARPSQYTVQAPDDIPIMHDIGLEMPRVNAEAPNITWTAAHLEAWGRACGSNNPMVTTLIEAIREMRT